MSIKLLTIDNVSLRIPMRSQAIIKHIRCDIAQGDFVILLGGNGSGKSSLIKLINRSYTPTQGRIEFMQHNIKTYKHNDFAKKVITLTQSTHDSLFMNLSVAENGLLWEMRMQGMQLKQNKQQRINALADYLRSYHKKLVDHLDTPVSHLSGGEQQILILALCLRYQPQLLLLDEHTSALDPKLADLMMERTYQAVSERGVTCIMTTHHLGFAMRYGNRLVALKAGEVIHDIAQQEKSQLSAEQLLDVCY